jgi:hypothetical protein
LVSLVLQAPCGACLFYQHGHFMSSKHTADAISILPTPELLPYVIKPFVIPYIFAVEVSKRLSNRVMEKNYSGENILCHTKYSMK